MEVLMSVRAATLIVVLFAAGAAFAADPQTTSTTTPGAILYTFCNQEYALCIKAPCGPIVSRKPDGTYSIEEANCTCDVLTGWSMGPGACDKRATVTVSGRTYVISTYSNFFNKTNLTLSCPSSYQMWALCYGAPCVIDEIGPSMTLGGECQQDACKSIWSAAAPKADAFANDHFFQYMTQNGLQPPPNPPAKACPDTSTQK